ncbi:MAG: ABC transporter ATP-binding protein [Alphaproteobacteria bacterium]|nr:ABC transporter ATP-binding protein [Alphaproteobacteria bacterium]
MTETLLELAGVDAGYTAQKALQGITMSFPAGKVVTLLGPNGAGKSTVLKTIFGLLPARAGTISWQGQTIRPIPYAMVQDGMSYVPQGRSVFPNLSVRENLETAVYFLRDKKDVKARLEEMRALFPALKDKWDEPAGRLSGGQQQMVVLARGLMTRPKMLLLDEPSLGLSPKLVKEAFAKIGEINRTLGTAFVIVEHNLKSLLGIVDYAYILRQGQIVTEGNPADKGIQDVILKMFKL